MLSNAISRRMLLLILPLCGLWMMPGCKSGGAATPPEGALSEAREKALTFLSRSAWEFDHVYLYSGYRARFGWPELPVLQRKNAIRDSLLAAGERRQVEQMDLYMRMLKPDFRLPEGGLEKARELDRVMLPALYCDQFVIDTAAYFPLLRETEARGTYGPPHILQALTWVAEKGCAKGATWRRWRSRSVKATRAVLEAQSEWTDLRIECMAVLCLAAEKLTGSMVSDLLARQQADGGWADPAKGPGSDTHTTVLALLVIELSR